MTADQSRDNSFAMVRQKLARRNSSHSVKKNPKKQKQAKWEAQLSETATQTV